MTVRHLFNQVILRESRPPEESGLLRKATKGAPPGAERNRLLQKATRLERPRGSASGEINRTLKNEDGALPGASSMARYRQITPPQCSRSRSALLASLNLPRI